MYQWREDACLGGNSTIGSDAYLGLRIEGWLLIVEIYFTGVFLAEASLKIFAWAPKYYFSGAWDITDFVICVTTTLALGARLLKYIPISDEDEASCIRTYVVLVVCSFEIFGFFSMSKAEFIEHHHRHRVTHCYCMTESNNQDQPH